MHCDLVSVTKCIHAPLWSYPSLHLTLPILTTDSGQPKFPLSRLCLASGSETESGNEDYPENCDNSFKLWVFQQGGAYPGHDSAQCTDFENWDCMRKLHCTSVRMFMELMECVVIG